MPPASARGPGWGSLPEDLVCAVAALVPVRERYGALPALNRHFHAISQRWPIQCGVWQLAEPATPLTQKGLERRSQRLISWLGCHPGQLRLLGDDIPNQLQLALDGRRRASSIYDSELLTLLKPTVAAILKGHCGALVSLKLWLPAPPPAVAGDADQSGGGSGAAEGSPLEGHSSLTRLQLDNFRGSAAELAALLEPAARLQHLDLLLKGDLMQPQLLADMQAQPTQCSILTALSYEMPSSPHRLAELPGVPPGLPSCTALTSLELQLLRSVWDTTAPPSPQLPHSMSNLRCRLCWAVCRCKLGAAAPLPDVAAAHAVRNAGMPHTLSALAPTLKSLEFDRCTMQRLPIVVSTFTGLTCLSLRLVTLVYDLPPWLALLTVLRRLEYQVSVQNHYTRGLPDVLDALPSLQSLDWAGGVVRTVRQGAYLSRLTSLHSVPDAYAFTPLLRKDFLDISALTGGSALLDLSLSHYSDEPFCKLRGAEALGGIRLTRVCLSDMVADMLPPPGAYLASLRSLSLDTCKLGPGLAAATGLTQLEIVFCESSYLDDLWIQLKELLPRWPLLKEMHVTDMRGEDPLPCKLLTGELLASMGLAGGSDGESEEGQGA